MEIKKKNDDENKTNVATQYVTLKFQDFFFFFNNVEPEISVIFLTLIYSREKKKKKAI